jgi:hypothetical protein
MESRSTKRYRNPGPKQRPRGKPFAKGNKLGGRTPLPPDVKAAFAAMLPDAIKALKSIVNAKTHSRREQAAEYITNRVGGTPEGTTKVLASGPNGEPLGGPLKVEVSFCSTPLSIGRAEVVHVGPDGKPVEVVPAIRDDQIEATPPQLRRGS